MNYSSTYASCHSNLGKYIRNEFCSKKSDLRNSLHQHMEAVVRSEPIHEARLKGNKKNQRMTGFLRILSSGKTVQLMFSVMGVCMVYAIWAVREHHRALLFGNGKCFSTSYWTDHNCPMAF